MISESRQKANDKYIKNHYSGFSIKLPNDIADRFRKVAEENGDSIRGILKEAIEKYIADNERK